MLSFAFSPAGRLPKHTPTKYPDVLKVNGAFTVTIDGRIYFTEKTLSTLIRPVVTFENGRKWTHFSDSFENGRIWAQ